MVMPTDREVLRYHPKTARHSEVQKGAARGKVQEEVFGTPAKS
jgi:hypothetical protein